MGLELLTDITYQDGKDNMAGVTKDAFIGIVSHFSSIAKPIANPVALGDGVKIPTAHVLATGKKTYRVFNMYEKSGVESTKVGQRKSGSWKPKGKYFYPGTDAEIIDFVALILNSDLLAFQTPMDEAGMIQIGSEALPAYVITGSVKTGEGPEGEKGVMFEVEAPSRRAWYIYTAALPRLGV